MNKFLLSFLYVSFFFCLHALSAEEATAASAAEETAPDSKPNVAKISEAFGHLLGRNLDAMGMKFDIAKVIKGLQDAAEGKESPMTEMEFFQAKAAIEESIFKEISSTNLKEAEAFLEKNKTESGIHILEEGKLQYKISHEGKGAAIEENSIPLVRYTGKFLNGPAFGSPKEEEIIHLEDAVAGLRKGLIGMKEGEKRTIFIHPNLAYGSHGGNLPPNSLVTFEIEVVQANAPYAESLDSLSPTTPKTKGNPEIAAPFEEPKIIR